MKVSEVKNNLKTEGLEKSIEWSVSESSFIFDLLSTKLYKNPHLAITRELITNAWDAHIETNNVTKPIEVNLPTNTTPYLVIKDYGMGLSPERAKELYTRIGESSKRENNKQQGGLGIGRMSAFSLSDQFTIETVFENIKYTYVVFKNSRNIPELASDNYAGEPTNEPSGTKIMVPIKKGDVGRVQSEGINLFRFFKVQPICNIQLPVFNNLYETPSYTLENGHGNVYAVMGSIVYPIDKNIINSNLHYYNLYLQFKIGELSVETSRDGLVYDDKTRNKVVEALSSFKKDIKERLSKEFEGLSGWELYCKKNKINADFRDLINCISSVSLLNFGDIEEVNYDFRRINTHKKDEKIFPSYSTVVFIKDKTNRFLKPLKEWAYLNKKHEVYLIPDTKEAINDFTKTVGLKESDLLRTSIFKSEPVKRGPSLGIKGISLLKSDRFRSKSFSPLTTIPPIKYYVVRNNSFLEIRGRLFSPSHIIRNFGFDNKGVSYNNEPIYAINKSQLRKLPKDSIDICEHLIKLDEAKLDADSVEIMERYNNVNDTNFLYQWGIPEFKRIGEELSKNLKRSKELKNVVAKLSSVGVIISRPKLDEKELEHETIYKKSKILKYVSVPHNKDDRKFFETLIQKELEGKL